MKLQKLSKRLKERAGSAFARNSGWIIFEQIYRMVFSFIISILTARYLGPSNMGVLTYAATFVAAFLPLSLLGLEQIVIREIVKNPENTDVILGSGILMRLLAGIASWICIFASVFFLKKGDHLYLTVAALNSVSLILYSITLTESWLQANLRSKYATIIKSVAYTVMSLYKVYLLAAGKSIIWFAAATSLDTLIIALLYFVLFYARGKLSFKPEPQMMKRLIKQSYPFIFSGLMVVFYGQIERIVLEQYHGAAALGNYGIGLSISYTWQFVPSAIIISARPLLLKLKDTDHAMFLRRLKQLYSFVWWLSVLVAVVFTFSADWLVRLMYGDAYAGAAAALKIVTWSQGFSLIGGVRDIWFIAENKNRYLIVTQGASALFALLAYMLFIPRYDISGAAGCVVLVQLFVALVSTLLKKETRESTRIICNAMMLRF